MHLLSIFKIVTIGYNVLNNYTCWKHLPFHIYKMVNIYLYFEMCIKNDCWVFNGSKYWKWKWTPSTYQFQIDLYNLKIHVSFLIQQIQHSQWFQTNLHVAQQHILGFMASLKNNYCFFYYVYNYLITKITM